jgi:hypothetical protein
MNEVEIPLKIGGLAAVKAELKDLKGQLVNATDPAEIARLSKAAGVLSDKIKDANEQVKMFATGSKFEAVSNGFGGIKRSLMSLDFEEANKKSELLVSTMGSLGKDDISKALKGLGGTVKNLGMAFMKLGLQILMNPIFLLTVVIVAIVVAIALVLNKFGVLQKVLDVLMIPIRALIDGFKMLTDWMGITSFAADENAEKVTAAMEKASAASKERAEDMGKSYDHEIAMAKIAGKTTVNLEIEKSYNTQKEAQSRVRDNYATLKAISHQTDEDAMKKKQKLKDDIKAENDLISKGVNDREIIRANFAKEVTADAAKAATDAAAANAAAYKERLAKQKEAAANRLAAERQIEDLRIAAIQDAGLREQATIAEKYKRLRADLLKDATKNGIEKAALLKAFNAAEKIEVAKTEEEKKKIANENYQSLQALEISNMVEGEAKIAKQQQVALQLARNAAKAKYGAESEQFVLFNEQLEIADTAATKARSNKKIADQQALLTSITDLALTEDQRKIAAIEAQYLTEQELANGHAETLLALKNKHDKDIENANTMAANAAVEKDKQVRDAKLGFAKDTVDGLTNLGGMLIKDQAKLAKFNKASALVQIGIDTAKAISALVAASNTNPLNGVTGGGAGIAQFAAGIIQIATNVAKAKSILSSPSTSATASGGGGGESGGGGSSTSQVVPQSAQLFGSANTGGTMSAGGTSTEGNTSMTVTAIVSESQVTSVQDKINRINKNSEL